METYYKYIARKPLKKESTHDNTNKTEFYCEILLYKQLFNTTRYYLIFTIYINARCYLNIT